MDAPHITDKWLPTQKWNPNRFDWERGTQARPRFIVIHIQQGSSENSWKYHAYEVKASATVFVNRDGSIWRCVREEHGPWTNGDVCLSTAAGMRVRQLGGDPNNWCLTIETEGFSYEPNGFGWIAAPTEPQFRSVLWQVRRWMEQYDIPVENVIRHADLNNCTDAQYRQHVNPRCTPENKCWGGRYFCPGDAYYGRLISALQEAVIEEPVAPPPPAFTREDVTLNDHIFHAVPVGQQEVRALVDGLECRKYATTNAPRVREPLAEGESFVAHYWVEGQNVGGETRWWVADDGARIWCGGTDTTPDDVPHLEHAGFSAGAMSLRAFASPQRVNATTDITSPIWGNVPKYWLSRHNEQLVDNDPEFDCNWYSFVLEYCMNWSAGVCYHPGIDVSMDYGTTLYAPASGRITCAGTGVGQGYDNSDCAAYPDYGPGGAGRVELLLDDGTVLIYGHCATALAPVGTRVEASTAIATSGHMASDHLHFEVRVPNSGCNTGYAIVDPVTFDWFSGTPPGAEPFQPGDKIQVANAEGLNLRTEPSSAGGEATVITLLSNGTKLDVLDGPIATDGLDWYQVRVAAAGGWAWREIGPTTAAVWEYELRNITPAGSPMLPEAAACHAAAQDHSALALAMAWVEQKYGTYTAVIPAWHHNPMSLRDGAGGWQQFQTYADGIAAWYRLLTDPNFLYANTTTVAELIHIYAPDWDPDLPPGQSQEAKYVREIDQLVTRYRALEGASPADPGDTGLAGQTGYVAGMYCQRLNRFQVGDQIQVIDGPINIRPQANTANSPVGTYQTGTEICVTDGPVFAENHEWYRVEGYGYDGWVAGELCSLLNRGGCA